MDERWILLDRETGLHVGWYFWLRLLDEVGRSDRYGNPFGLLLIDVATSARRGGHEALSEVSAAIRGTDLGGLIGPGRAAVILTQQEPDAAQAAMTRILARVSPEAAVLLNPSLLCYPRDAAEITHLLTLRAPLQASA